MKRRSPLTVENKFESFYGERISYRTYKQLWGVNIFSTRNHAKLINSIYSTICIDLQAAISRICKQEEEL